MWVDIIQFLTMFISNLHSWLSKCPPFSHIDSSISDCSMEQAPLIGGPSLPDISGLAPRETSSDNVIQTGGGRRRRRRRRTWRRRRRRRRRIRRRMRRRRMSKRRSWNKEKNLWRRGKRTGCSGWKLWWYIRSEGDSTPQRLETLYVRWQSQQLIVFYCVVHYYTPENYEM